MMTMMNSMAVEHFKDLGSAFLATVTGMPLSVFRGEASGPMVCTKGDGLQTSFYLNPYEANEPCAGFDWTVIFLAFLIVHVISWGGRWLLWQPMADWRMKGHKAWSKEESKRFGVASTSLLFFTASAFFVCRVVYPKGWLFERSTWKVAMFVVDADFKFYYLLYIARFCSDSVSLFFEDRRKDAFITSAIHHVVTIGLVLASIQVGYLRYGGIIMFVFDWADIPLLSAKLFKYLSKELGDAYQFAANRLFELFALVFMFTRNIWYNYLAWCAWFDLEMTFYDHVCRALLLALVVLQTYWLGLLIQVIINQQQNDGHASDIREDNNNNNAPQKKES